jgi:hypothetical protein
VDRLGVTDGVGFALAVLSFGLAPLRRPLRMIGLG